MDLPNIKGVALPRSVKSEGSDQTPQKKDTEQCRIYPWLTLLETFHCSIIFGKSRVAPLKPVTIPRMELTATTLAARLDKHLRRELSIPIHETVLWTDSTLVLQYIRNESRRFQTFVANRLAMIHDASKPSQWRHVNSSSNPADHASRGLKTYEKVKLQQWLEGPEFLWQDQKYWPVQPEQLSELPTDHKELKKKTAEVHTILVNDNLDDLLRRYSSWCGCCVSSSISSPRLGGKQPSQLKAIWQSEIWIAQPKKSLKSCNVSHSQRSLPFSSTAAPTC